jgi:hypothetical protein
MVQTTPLPTLPHLPLSADAIADPGLCYHVHAATITTTIIITFNDRPSYHHNQRYRHARLMLSRNVNAPHDRPLSSTVNKDHPREDDYVIPCARG